jgi:hypothetical protein
MAENGTVLFWGTIALIIGTLYIVWLYLKRKYNLRFEIDFND